MAGKEASKGFYKKFITILIGILILIFGFYMINDSPKEMDKTSEDKNTISTLQDQGYKYDMQIKEGTRRHSCELHIQEEIKVAECNFETDMGEQSGKIIHKNNSLYLFRESPNQAIEFPENATIYGFGLPNKNNVKLLNSSDEALKYRIEETSEIRFSNKRETSYDFKFPEDTHFFKKNDLVFNVK